MIILMKPPKANRIKKELKSHNHVRIDNYSWLSDKTDPGVIEYLNAENKYTASAMKHTENLRGVLYDEMVGRIKQDDSSVPYLENGYYHYHRFEMGKEYPLYCRKKESLEAGEEIILNVNEIADGFEFFNVIGLNVSPDNKILAYCVDTNGRRQYEIYFKDLAGNILLPDKIPGTSGNLVWANDSRTIFYSQKDRTLRPYKIFKHTLGAANDEEVYHEDDETFGTYVFKTKSSRFIIIGSYNTLSNEYRFLDAGQPSGEFIIFHEREKDLEYYIDHFEDHFYITTNFKAKNFRLMKTPVERTAKDNWEEVIPHRENILLEGIEIFKDYLVIQEREDGLKKLKIVNWNDFTGEYIKFNEDTYTIYVSKNPEFNSRKLRFVYNSLTTPVSTYDYDMAGRKEKLLKREEVLGGFNPNEYHSERVYAAAPDGTRIPISIVYKKGIEKTKPNPLLLNGYGAYGISNDPGFNSARLSLLDRGVVFAIAHIRGGQEMGRQWYEDGKLLRKINTFTDFIACAQFLIENNYTAKEKLFAIGGSAGGLLMGAVSNMRPDLFKGIIAAVPFVDVLTTMLDENIPLTTGEYDEWGNPNEKIYYDYILSYSPYDNVSKQDYPAMFVSTALNDSQVQYWEPAKWAAKLREMKTDNNLLILNTNMSAGHGGASGRFEQFKLIALEYSFILDQLGINK